MGNKQSATAGPGTAHGASTGGQRGFERVGVTGTGYVAENKKGTAGTVGRPVKPVRVGKPTGSLLPNQAADASIDQFGNTNEPLSVQGTQATLVLPSPRKVAPSPSTGTVLPLRHQIPVQQPITLVAYPSANTSGTESVRPASPVISRKNSSSGGSSLRQEPFHVIPSSTTHAGRVGVGAKEREPQSDSPIINARNSDSAIIENSRKGRVGGADGSDSDGDSRSTRAVRAKTRPVTGAAKNNNGNNGGTSSAAAAAAAANATAAPFDFSLTEGQTRRTAMADCEFECSEIIPGLYVSGASVATDREALRRHNIRRIVNCAASVVPSPFIGELAAASTSKAVSSAEPAATADTQQQQQQQQQPPLFFRYKQLKMVDGRQDDVGWFVCEVLQFVLAGREAGENVLVHCEKGISRSCSYVIAFLMWQYRSQWKSAFDTVKLKRHVCNPNTAFTCNLIEAADLMHGDKRKVPVLFRLATHLPHDRDTPVLKALRDEGTRRLLVPGWSLLDPRGVFVLRPAQAASSSQPSKTAGSGGSGSGSGSNEGVGVGVGGIGPFVWVGSQAAAACPQLAEVARLLAVHMVGVFTAPGLPVTVVWQGKEPPAFSILVQKDGAFSGRGYDDLYVDSYPGPGPLTGTLAAAAAAGDVSASQQLQFGSEIDASVHQSRSRGSSPAPAPAPAPAQSRALPLPTTHVGHAESQSDKPVRAGTGTGARVGEVGAGSPPSRSGTPPTSKSGSRPGSATSATPPSRPRTASDSNGHDVSLLTPVQQRRTPPPTVPRTPSAGKLPVDLAMVRGPTPVEEHPLAVGSGSHGGGSGGIALLHASKLPGPSSQPPQQQQLNLARNILEGSHHPQKAAPATAAAAAAVAAAAVAAASGGGGGGGGKPKLYVCVEKDGGGGAGHEWQAMGVYDDEDLDDALLLLLHCSRGRGPHRLWLGAEYDADHEDVCTEDETLLEWACQQVDAGENGEWRDIFPCDIKLHRSGEEDDGFWEAFNDGF